MAQVVDLAGGLRGVPLQTVLDQERASAQATQAQPMVSALAGHIRQQFNFARMAKMAKIDERLLQSVRARRGEYDPDKAGQIAEMGGSDVYAMLTSVKCRAAGAWIRDVIAGQGDDRPWDIKSTALPQLPPDIHEEIIKASMAPIMAAEQAGVPMTDIEIQQLQQALMDAATNEMKEQAEKAADRMADKMEEQLQLGGFADAIDQFIDDVVTFPCGIIKGPIMRKKPVLTWGPDPERPGGFLPQITQSIKMEWERVSPFDIYPSPSATEIDNGTLIERHRLSRQDLNELIGVDGYDDASIKMVLAQYAMGGLHEWLLNDSAQADAEGKSLLSIGVNTDGLIDALQFWGSVPGEMLRTWGMDEKDVPDVTGEYHIEAWLIAGTVIKAVLNYDPLHRKPYYKASYEDIPGAWWGNSVADLVRPSQVVVNATARAIVNNMSMSSGPQVGINVDRLPAGEPITTLTPWKIWQFKDDALGGGAAPPLTFFQPESFVGELMQVFEKFSELADEYSGIPRYMTGDSSGGAGRTASGLSMLVGNAAKSIKQVISNIDNNITKPVLERLYMNNMMYSDDPTLKGDVNIIANGASALMAKEAAQVRRNEFLAATMNPVDMQIVGLKGRAAILRETVKTLDMDPDDIIPPPEVLAAKQATMEAQQAQAAAQQGGGAAPQGGGPAIGTPPGPATPMPAPPQMMSPPGGTPAGPPVTNAQTLQNGAPITDNFAPTPK